MSENLTDKVCAVVLAGGKGDRLGSYIPKVLNPLAGKAMILHTLDTLNQLHPSSITIVVGFKAELVKAVLGDYYNYAHQDPQSPKGTGDALKVALDWLEGGGQNILLINGDDSAFFTQETIKNFIEFHRDRANTLSFISTRLEEPTGFGRVVKDAEGKVLKIVEENEASDREKQIKEINTGVYLFKRSWVETAVHEIKLSKKRECYITDLIAIALKENEKVGVLPLKDPDEWFGVNTPGQLTEANRRMISRLKARKKRELTFIVDIDNTILNTARLKKVLVATILDVLGVASAEKKRVEDIFWQVYEEIRREQGYIDIPATAREFCQRLGKQEFAKIISYFMLLTPSPNLLYPLVYQTIERLRDYGRVVIFTDGDLIYQPIKVERIGIPHVVPRRNIYVFHDKIPHVEDLLEIHATSDKIFVIDDKIKVLEEFKKLREDVVGVLVKQGEYAERYGPDQLKIADFVVHNFAQVLDLSKYFRVL